ncbi:hypothetical protein CDD81_376 [Ophiocordyceps australis]|uniref:Uncharacterized protein n=1 Tax=Ophiocordyceps australis TaxID=1399860 RepID=A0A2C5XG77_9HYPO|nr:hypothetical protein CDD81_376 [Ophiocordyceps australis]
MFCARRRIAQCLFRVARQTRRTGTTVAHKVAQDGPAKKIDYYFPDKILIYYAGVFRITVVMLLKVSSILVAATVGISVAPRYVEARRPDAPLIVLSAVLPLVATAFLTGSYVSFIKLHLPPQARLSPAALRHWLDTALTSQIYLDITTMGLLFPRPRTRELMALELRRAPRYMFVTYRIVPEQLQRLPQGGRARSRAKREAQRKAEQEAKGWGPAEVLDWLLACLPSKGFYIRDDLTCQGETDPPRIWDQIRYKINILAHVTPEF